MKNMMVGRSKLAEGIAVEWVIRKDRQQAGK
jgi:hypothetical protein